MQKLKWVQKAEIQLYVNISLTIAIDMILMHLLFQKVSKQHLTTGHQLTTWKKDEVLYSIAILSITPDGPFVWASLIILLFNTIVQIPPAELVLVASLIFS